MLKKLDKIRFRGHKRDEFLDLAESPNASDTECGDEIPVKIPRTSARENEELRDPVSTQISIIILYYVIYFTGRKITDITNSLSIYYGCKT